jgi:hypothetical protein
MKKKRPKIQLFFFRNKFETKKKNKILAHKEKKPLFLKKESQQVQKKIWGCGVIFGNLS